MKAKIRKTGEVVDVINYSNRVGRGDESVDYVSYIDSKGIEHHYERGLNFYWDFERIENNTIDWEQRRYEIAKEIMAHTDGGCHVKHDAIEAVRGADALIAELKKK